MRTAGRGFRAARYRIQHGVQWYLGIILNVKRAALAAGPFDEVLEGAGYRI